MSSEPLPQEIVDEIATSFGLQVTQQEVPPIGHFIYPNAVVLVTTLHPQTGVDRKYVVKPYDPRQFTPEMISFQHTASKYLARQGILTPKLEENTEEETFIVLSSGLIVAVSEHIEGVRLDPENEYHAHKALAALGAMNLAFSGFNEWEGYHAQSRFSRPITEQFDEMCGYLPTTPQNAADEYVLTQQPRIRRLVGQIEAEKAALALPRQLIHGNYNFGAAILDQKGQVHVIDFAALRKDIRGTDTIHSLDLLCDFDKERQGLTANQRINHDRLRRGFRAYRTRDPSIEEQVEAMPLLLAEYGLNSLIVTWRGGYDPAATPQAKAYFPGRYAFFVNRVDIALDAGEDIIRTLKEA